MRGEEGSSRSQVVGVKETRIVFTAVVCGVLSLCVLSDCMVLLAAHPRQNSGVQVRMWLDPGCPLEKCVDCSERVGMLWDARNHPCDPVNTCPVGTEDAVPLVGFLFAPLEMGSILTS